MRFLQPILALVLGHSLLAGPLAAEGKSIIVLDASGSMWGQIDGRAKLEIAREALGSVLSAIPAETEIGLMAYGHREKGSCTDIELIVPPAAATAGAITDAANTLKFLGKTPLSDAVRRAADELRSTEEKATVILITDGIETCEADPCALGTELEASGVDFTAHVVGFGLTAAEGATVACLAQNTGGLYIEAKDAGSLVEALTTVVVAEPEPEPAPPEPVILAENVDPVLHLVIGGPEPEDAILMDAYFDFVAIGSDGTPGSDSAATIYGRSLGQLPAGRYLMRTTLHSVTVEQEVEIGPESEVSRPVAVLDAGILRLQLVTEAGGEPEANALWELYGPEGLYDSGYGQTVRVFPAGEHEITAKLEEVTARQSAVITAGETTDMTIILAGGVPVFAAYYAEGVPMEGDQSFDVYSAKAGLDGKRPYVRTDYGAGSAPTLPPGDYVVIGGVGEAKVEVPFTVKPGERFDVPVILNAGIAVISAPNASALELYAAKIGLDGKRAYIRSDYGDVIQYTLPAGDYYATAKAGEATGDITFTVAAAERTEATITIAVGLAAVSAPGATALQVYDAKVGLDGKRKEVRFNYGETADYMLPPGDYVIEARSDKALAETAFSVTDGTRTEVSVIIPRGVAAISAPGAREITIYLPPDGLNGKRERISGDYGEVSQSTLPPGDYIVVTDFGSDIEVEQPITLADGQRLEIEVVRP